MRSRTAKRPGPLLHQQRLHSARQHRCNTATQRWDSEIAYSETLQKAMFAPVSPAALAAVDAYKAQEKHLGTAGCEVRWSFSEFPDAPSSLSPRAISITDLDDRIVIEVGAAELRLTKGEAARLFAMGAVYARKPQA